MTTLAVTQITRCDDKPMKAFVFLLAAFHIPMFDADAGFAARGLTQGR
jgi:hypothetical protein